jgi:hypothetical protein
LEFLKSGFLRARNRRFRLRLFVCFSVLPFVRPKKETRGKPMRGTFPGHLEKLASMNTYLYSHLNLGLSEKK